MTHVGRALAAVILLLTCATLSDRMVPESATAKPVSTALIAAQTEPSGVLPGTLPSSARDPILMFVVGCMLIGLGGVTRGTRHGA